MNNVHEHFQPSIYSAACLKNIKRREKTLNIIQLEGLSATVNLRKRHFFLVD